MEFAFTPGAGGAAPRGALVPRGEPGGAARGAARARLARRLGARGARRRRALVRRRGDPVRGGRPRALHRAVPDDRGRPPRAAARWTSNAWSVELDGLVPDLRHGRPGAARGHDVRSGRGRDARDVDETRPLGTARGNRTTESRSTASSRPVRLRLLAGARARGGRVAQKALELGVEYVSPARAVREEDRHLPGRLAPARRHLRRDRARPLARLLGRLVRRRGRRAGARRGRRREVVLRRDRRRRLRALDPGARRHRLHLGARPAPLLQARAVDRRVRRPRRRRSARSSPRTYSTRRLHCRSRKRKCSS